MGIEEMQIQGYGSAEWQREGVTAEKALAQLTQLSDADFSELRQAILHDLEPHGLFEWADKGHVKQVVSVAKRLADASGEYPTKEETRLVELCALLHDAGKEPLVSTNLLTHAYLSAEAIPLYFRRLTSDRSVSETDSAPSAPMSPTLTESLRASQDLALFLAKVVETHSSIPFIDAAFSYGALDKIHENSGLGEEALPYLDSRSDPSDRQFHGLPEPNDKYGRLIRAADTLSNYGVMPGLEVLQDNGDVDSNPLARYAGLLKIIMFDAGETLSEKLYDIARDGDRAVNAGVYDRIPTAGAIAKQSAARATWLGDYYRDNNEKVDVMGDQIEVQDLWMWRERYYHRYRQAADELYIHSNEKFRRTVSSLAERLTAFDRCLNEVYLKGFAEMERAIEEGRLQ